jgi:23S rRNA (adenine2503-C2)-methyltransferase
VNVINLLDLSLVELEDYLQKQGLPKFRAKQIWNWVYNQSQFDFSQMTNLGKDLREVLAREFSIDVPAIVAEQEAEDGTVKFGLRFPDGTIIETVLMHYRYGYTTCVSTQAGCAMGCIFCASTLTGVARNLTAGEIAAQVLVCDRFLMAKGERVRRVVYMGSGEPLANLQNVTKSIELLNSPEGVNIGMRRFTVSTAGWVPGIYALAEKAWPITLAVSLHAPTNDLRSTIMPVNERFPLEKLIPAVRAYVEKTGRRVTFEYTLMRGVNDDEEYARKLGDLVKGMLAHVNLIPVNPVIERGFQPPPRAVVDKFQSILEGMGVAVTVRRFLGAEADAACGQLRARLVEDAEGE